MNLHVANDTYGFFATEVAKRIQGSKYSDNNLVLNLSEVSEIRHETITYIPVSISSYKNFVNNLNNLDKVIFHPYTIDTYLFLGEVLKKFPHIKVFWVCWSYDVYSQPEFISNLYEPFSANYLKSKRNIYNTFLPNTKKLIKNLLYYFKFLRNYQWELNNSFKRIDYFCSFLPSDFNAALSLSEKIRMKYLPFSYLSLETIIPDLYSFDGKPGNEIMIGHSASPSGNHYEIIQKLSSINRKFPVFLPLAYGEKNYANVIKEEAIKKFENVEILEEKLEIHDYYRRLTRLGWAIINTKVQQGLGNILGLIWIGVKLFLDKNSTTYVDFKRWGIIVYNVQDDLTEIHLTTKLSPEEIQLNRRIMLERFNEGKVKEYWVPLLD